MSLKNKIEEKIFIAPVFISKFLVQNKVKVKKLIFVCGFNNYLGINKEYDAEKEFADAVATEQVIIFTNENGNFLIIKKTVAYIFLYKLQSKS